MVSREEAIAIALKLAADDPQRRPVERVDEVFSADGGQTWTVHLVPVPLDLGDGTIAFDTPSTWPVCVNVRTGKARWMESF